MFRDFENAPSKSSYQMKFLLAALAAVALLLAWAAYGKLGHERDAVGFERDRMAERLQKVSNSLGVATEERDAVASDLGKAREAVPGCTGS